MSFRPKTVLDLINYSSTPPKLPMPYHDTGPVATICTFCGATIEANVIEGLEYGLDYWMEWWWCKECHKITNDSCCYNFTSKVQSSFFRIGKGFPIIPPSILPEFFSFLDGEGAKEFVTYCGCDGYCFYNNPNCCKMKTRVLGLFWKKKLPLDLIREYYLLFFGF